MSRPPRNRDTWHPWVSYILFFGFACILGQVLFGYPVDTYFEPHEVFFPALVGFEVPIWTSAMLFALILARRRAWAPRPVVMVTAAATSLGMVAGALMRVVAVESAVQEYRNISGSGLLNHVDVFHYGYASWPHTVSAVGIAMMSGAVILVLGARARLHLAMTVIAAQCLVVSILSAWTGPILAMCVGALCAVAGIGAAVITMEPGRHRYLSEK